MGNLFNFFVKQKKLALIFTVSVIAVGLLAFNNITPSHPSHAVNIFCARPSMAVGWCLHRRLRRKKKKKIQPHPMHFLPSSDERA
jgi:hypothetical protein